MGDYKHAISDVKIQSINDIVDWCHDSLPEQFKTFPWRHPELNHGIDLLASDEALNCYMSAYGDMHISKCRAAMMSFPYEELTGNIEIVDWGCGQGIGSATVIDVLKQRERLSWVKKVTLIEPSNSALHRAVCNISKLTNGWVQIEAVNKFMPASVGSSDETMSALGYQYANVIHVFSNILDVKLIDLANVAKMVASSHGKHFVLCMGPKNGAAFRIEQFCSVFGEQKFFSKIDSVSYGRTKRSGHPYTCFTRCFIYDGSPLDSSRMGQYRDPGQEVYDEYDWQLQIENEVLSPQKARVAYRLQNILAVDDIMYLSPVINEVTVDFVIVRPQKGLLLVNVFEKDLKNCVLAGNTIISNDSETYMSPIELMNQCQTSIKDGIEELLISTIDNPRNFSLIKKIVIFSENSSDEVNIFFKAQNGEINYTYLYGSEFVKNKTISFDLYRRINMLYSNQSFDDSVKRRLASIISPSWHSYQEGRIGVKPEGAQKKLVVSRSTQQKISGVAGSGKTYVLAVRAINAIKRTGGDVLILTFNITLRNYLRFRLSELREDFSWDKIDIYHYHQFFRIRATECRQHVHFDSFEDVNFFSETPEHKRYSAIFIDEVQDYKPEWLKIISQEFLEPGGELVVFGDPKQNVYHRQLDEQKDIRLGIIPGLWNKDLKKGQRFIIPRLASLAMSFQKHFLPNLSMDNIETGAEINELDFPAVTYFDMRNNCRMEVIARKLKEIIDKENNSVKDFVVLGSTNNFLRFVDAQYRTLTNKKTEVTFVTTEQLEHLKTVHNIEDENKANWKFNRDYEALSRARKLLFTTDMPYLKISTVQSFKGWESPFVILFLERDNLLDDGSFRPMAPETIYTAITRARESLYVINIGNDTYHKFFKTQSI